MSHNLVGLSVTKLTSHADGRSGDEQTDKQTTCHHNKISYCRVLRWWIICYLFIEQRICRILAWPGVLDNVGGGVSCLGN